MWYGRNLVCCLQWILLQLLVGVDCAACLRECACVCLRAYILWVLGLLCSVYLCNFSLDCLRCMVVVRERACICVLMWWFVGRLLWLYLIRIRRCCVTFPLVAHYYEEMWCAARDLPCSPSRKHFIEETINNNNNNNKNEINGVDYQKERKKGLAERQFIVGSPTAHPQASKEAADQSHICYHSSTN